MGHGFWIQRSPTIRKDEWYSFVASQPDLAEPSEQFGHFPEHRENRPNLPEFVWWTRDTALPGKVIFVRGSIFIEASDAEAGAFAKRIAEHFNGTAQEG